MIKSTCHCGGIFEIDSTIHHVDTERTDRWLDRHQACIAQRVAAQQLANKKASTVTWPSGADYIGNTDGDRRFSSLDAICGYCNRDSAQTGQHAPGCPFHSLENKI